MSKELTTLTVVGDLHLNAITPKSRVDDFAGASIDKLEALLDICTTKDYKNVLLLGDFTHAPNQPIWFINKLISVLTKFKDNNIEIYSIYGNHDLVHNDLENAYKCTLGLMFNTGLIKELRTESFVSKYGYDIALHGFHYPEAIEPLMARTHQAKVNICALHRYYEYGLAKNSLTKAQLSGLGYQVYAIGHLHTPFEPQKVEDFTLVRPGRVMRGTSDKFNVEDGTVYIDTLVFNGSQEAPRVTCIRDILPTKPASEVFSILAINKDRSGDKFLSDLSNKVSSLLNMMDTETNTSNNLYRILDKLEIDIRIKDRVEGYLKQEGIYRQSDEI